ncbi:MAG: flagellar hook-length control protein FliK [Defluviitaleaceae bacterium]|nr:flagellar hook-length control protein FliK [Defluviitaleaceae bacterium]
MKNLSVVAIRRFHELHPGDIFRAMIHDIRPGEVVIRFSGGELYTARSMVLPDARIGEVSLFSVRENDFEGKIVLEMVKADPDTKKNNMLTDAITNAGLSVTPEMLALGRGIIDRGIPVDAQVLHKVTFFAHASKEAQALNIDSVIFLLGEDMPVSLDTIQALNQILHNPQLLLSECSSVAHPHPSPKGILHFYRQLYAKIYEQLIPLKNVATVKEAYKKEALEKARDMILFMAHLKHRKYFQIPYASLVAEVHSSTHVSNTAIIAVETPTLGRVEVSIQNGTLAFHAAKDTTLQCLKQNTPRLTALLNQKGISLTMTEFKPITEPFTIRSALPNNQQKPTPVPKRYTFDMRV